MSADSQPHEGKLQDKDLASRLNWLRAAVLGANDGIVSVAGIVLGVAGATTNRTNISIAGIAGLIAGALSMAAGEYVSVSTQRDSERAMLRKERYKLGELPREKLEKLTQSYQRKGLTRDLAEQIAHQLIEHDALGAHAEVELGMCSERINPWHAAGASFIAFTIGALIPFLAILISGSSLRVPITFVAVIVALTITGVSSARLGQAADCRPAIIRNVLGGVVAMTVTYGVAHLVGCAI